MRHHQQWWWPKERLIEQLYPDDDERDPNVIRKCWSGVLAPQNLEAGLAQAETHSRPSRTGVPVQRALAPDCGSLRSRLMLGASATGHPVTCWPSASAARNAFDQTNGADHSAAPRR